MPDGATLLLFVGTSLAILAVPGPAVIYLVTRGLDQGRTAGIVSVLGVETAAFAYALAAAAGLTGLIAASEVGFIVVKYAGAGYLIYLGVRKLLEHDEPPETLSTARSRLFLRGVLVQLPNRPVGRSGGRLVAVDPSRRKEAPPRPTRVRDRRARRFGTRTGESVFKDVARARGCTKAAAEVGPS
jgi:hypothetical protein